MFNLTLISANVKTGPIPVSMSSKETCPDACPLKNGGCYGLGGPVNIHWKRLTEKKKGQLWADFVESVRTKIFGGQLWRHNAVGDLVGENNNIDGVSLKMLVAANKGKKGFTYTHKPVLPSENVSAKTIAANRKAIAHANKNGFTINLSADNLEMADKKHDLKIGPVTVILPSTQEEKVCYTPLGKKVIVCPATYMDNMNCSKCQLCQKQRSAIVGFPAHGVSKKKVDTIIAG